MKLVFRFVASKLVPIKLASLSFFYCDHFIEFMKLRTLIKQQIQTLYHNYLADIHLSISNNFKQFWLYVLSKNRTSGIPRKMNLIERFLGIPRV